MENKVDTRLNNLMIDRSGKNVSKVYKIANHKGKYD